MTVMQLVSTTRPRPVIANRIARFVVPDMTTHRCTRQIAGRMRRLDGVKSASANITTHKVIVHFAPQSTGPAAMTAEIERAGCNVADLVQTGVGRQPRGMQLVVSRMACDYSADHLTRALKRLPGVLVVTTQLVDHRVTVRFAPEKVDPGMIRAAVERAGYGIVCVKEI